MTQPLVFEPLTAEEFGEACPEGRKPSELTKRVRELAPGEGFMVKCVFKHYGGKGKDGASCGGSQCASRAARGAGFSVRTKHKNGMLLVFRPEEEERR